MSDWQQKRFWKEVAVEPAEGGYAILLDGRAVRTPAKAQLCVPGPALAEAIAAEWRAQEGTIDPGAMPFTRSANAAIDKVTPQHAAVADMLAAYGDSDLLCYRADAPAGLTQRQSDQWDPPLEWAAQTLGARLATRSGVMHKAQAPAPLARLAELTHALTPLRLTAFHDLVSLSGSLILGFATAHDWKTAEEIWTISRLDENWQREQWGSDEESDAEAEIKRTAFLHAKSFFDIAQGPLS